MSEALTLVLDIGKSHAKLLMIDAAGGVVERYGRDNRSVRSALGYPALDLAGLAAWITTTLRACGATHRCTRAIASTHGAAFVALGDAGVAWYPLDYEFDGVEALNPGYQAERDDFAQTLAPDLPAGLNAARQIHWVQQSFPAAWARTRTLLPYPQYWAWWLSGVAASECSSLGCHTQLWRPEARGFSALARRHGWAERFAPLQPAWQALGRVRPERASQTGLPETCEVFCGVHDSNACLARYLRSGAGMSLVSSGTWVVAMAPGGKTAALDPARDMLANVSVRGELVPTARFMGGRELEAICAGAAPSLSSLALIDELIAREVHALPSFAAQGGPFAGCAGRVLEAGRVIDAGTLVPALRATLAALYAAQVTALLLERLGAPLPVVLEGPFADNPVCVRTLAALLPPASLRLSTDPLEGTARGAWMLTRWNGPSGFEPAWREVAPEAALDAPVREHGARWRRQLGVALTS